MCLLVVASRLIPEFPLVVAANRDEWLARPAVPITVLRDREPRIVGGRDEVAQGTWLAASDRGVVAGLTNRPTPSGRDAALRSRGELPLLAAGHGSAANAADALSRLRADDYNPFWFLVGDRRSLHYIDLHEKEPTRALSAGVHILENRPLGAASAKADHVRAALSDLRTFDEPALVRHLAAVLSDHHIPEAARDSHRDASESSSSSRPLETEAACVHAGPYGTRSAEIVLIPRDESAPIRLYVARGRPCENVFYDESSLFIS